MSKEYPFIQFLIGYLIISIPFFLQASEANDLEIKSINAQIIKSLDDDILSLKGNVIIKTDVMDLWADEATYDRTKQVINLNGNIRALSKNLNPPYILYLIPLAINLSSKTLDCALDLYNMAISLLL